MCVCVCEFQSIFALNDEVELHTVATNNSADDVTEGGDPDHPAAGGLLLASVPRRAYVNAPLPPDVCRVSVRRDALIGPRFPSDAFCLGWTRFSLVLLGFYNVSMGFTVF